MYNVELAELVWGRRPSGSLSDSVFRRWTQGFVLSQSEATALEQFEGGPCAMIAPVQAYLLKNFLFHSEKQNWRSCTEEELKHIFCLTLSEILETVRINNSSPFCLVMWARGKASEEHASISENHPESSQGTEEEQLSALAADELGSERFHTLIQKRTFANGAELKEAVLNQYSSWRNRFGVLLFLYSVILTKGIANIRNEIEDAAEPLIDPVYGHGSQSLINLLLTGYAVLNVWDGDRECSGMKLHGVRNQAAIGFLTLMESLRYCKVGTYLKSPKFPVWILGSETHLTVFFAKERCRKARKNTEKIYEDFATTCEPEQGKRWAGSAAYHRWSWKPPWTVVSPTMGRGFNIEADPLPGIAPTTDFTIKSSQSLGEVESGAPTSQKVQPAPTRGSIAWCGRADIPPDAGADHLDAEDPKCRRLRESRSSRQQGLEAHDRGRTKGKNLNFISPSITVRNV
ncbi:ubiquitin carboxyl-terminal hydrolase MINDY-3 isoform X1 [Leucoraja erinacea]|uniref:ubiquitin carboxyl-terminal hydrolase MINDY-3 isoform X1 n=1 Tax=Leucoraja erinaceus TaxID=7782 RepID=UPI0024559C41|nr:ubiquitin carboxyl-terminal hydrolase MINDY-3 isoform X1 [Leucoraja erinacea]